jgi:two-component system sensor histidine kinase UhpB
MLRLEANDHGLTLVVEDRGRGFDSSAGRRGAGLGLIGMNERAALVGGRATVDARPGRGTTVTVSVPRGLDA